MSGTCQKIRDDIKHCYRGQDLTRPNATKMVMPCRSPRAIKRHHRKSVLVATILVAQTVKHLPAMQQTRVQPLGLEDPLEKEVATHSSTLAWKIPWMEEPGDRQSMGSQRVGHNWLTSLSFFFVFFSYALCAVAHPDRTKPWDFWILLFPIKLQNNCQN